MLLMLLPMLSIPITTWRWEVGQWTASNLEIRFVLVREYDVRFVSITQVRLLARPPRPLARLRLGPLVSRRFTTGNVI